MIAIQYGPAFTATKKQFKNVKLAFDFIPQRKLLIHLQYSSPFSDGSFVRQRSQVPPHQGQTDDAAPVSRGSIECQ